MDLQTPLSDSLLGADGITYQQHIDGFPQGGNSKIFSLENSTEGLQSQSHSSTTVTSPIALEDSFMGLGNGIRPDYNSLLEVNENLRSQLAQYQQLLMFLQQQAIESRSMIQPPNAAAAAAIQQASAQAAPLDNDALVLLDDDEYCFPRWTVTESTVRPYPVCIIRYNGNKTNLLVKVNPAPGYSFKTENHIAYYKAKDQTYLSPRDVGDIIVFELLHVEEVGNADGEQIQLEFSLYNIEGTQSTLIAKKISSPITVFNHSQYLPAPSITKLMPSWASAGASPKVDVFGPLFLRKNNILECQVAEADGTEYKLYTGTAIERKRNCFHAFTFTAPSHPAGKVVVRCRYRGRDFGGHRFFDFIQAPIHQGPRGASAITARGGDTAFSPIPEGGVSPGVPSVPKARGGRGGRGGGHSAGHHSPGAMGYAYANDEASLSALIASVTQSQECHALVNAQDDNGTTALFWAAFLGHLKCVEILLQNGAKSNLPNFRGDTPLHAACYASHDQVVRLLLTRGKANLKARDFVDELTALHVAAYVGHVPTLAVLCEDEDMDDVLTFKDRDGMIPLHLAVLGDNVEAVKLLLDYYRNNDLDINVRDSSGLTPLAWACQLDHYEIARELLQHLSAKDINVTDENKESALFHAVRNNNLELSRELCAKGASPNIFDRNRRTPMFISVREQNNNITMLLLEHGADASHADIFGRLPFQFMDLSESQLDGSRITVSRVAAKIYDRVAAGVPSAAGPTKPVAKYQTSTKKSTTILAPVAVTPVSIIPGTDTPMPTPDELGRSDSPPLPPDGVIPFEITPSYNITTSGDMVLSDSEIREVAQLTHTPAGAQAEPKAAHPATKITDSGETPGNPQLESVEVSKRAAELRQANDALSQRLKQLEMQLASKDAVLRERDAAIARLMQENQRLIGRRVAGK